MKNPKTILWAVLEIINFQDNKEEFADEFLKNCAKQALINLYNELPQEKKEELNNLQQENLDPQNLVSRIEEIVGTQTYQDSVKKATETAFTEYLNVVNPTLTASQKEQLESYLQTLPSAAH